MHPLSWPAGPLEAPQIQTVSLPDFGDPARIEPGEVPVFWACGMTPQAVVMAWPMPFAIAPMLGHNFITDILVSADHA